jgi:hypothetical protein
MRNLAAVLITCLALQSEMIDRIAVTVDNRVIAESEIIRQIRITAFLNGEPPDFSAANKRTTADRLVEQALIRRELETTRYAAQGASAATEYQELKKKYPDEDAYKAALQTTGITDKDVQEALQWQAVLLEFIDMRFRPGVQVPESDVQDYYNQQVSQSPGKLPPFEEARESIEEILTSRLVDNAVDRWLGQVRTQTRIKYTQEVFW